MRRGRNEPEAELAMSARNKAVRRGLVVVALILGASPIALADAAEARAARLLTVTDAAHLTLVSANGNTLVEKGSASGTMPGTVEVSLTLSGHTATSTFTIRTRGGTISGRGVGKLKTGVGGYDSFGGSVTVVRGSGRFRRAHGTAGLYGSIYRVTDALSVQVTGKLSY